MKKIILLLFLVYIIVLSYVLFFSNQVLQNQEEQTYQFKTNVTIFQFLQSKNYTFQEKIKNVGGNVLIFFPAGLFYAYSVINRRTSLKILLGAILIGFILSLCFEFIQLFWAYRIFDMDDIILNTVGTVLGSLLLLLTSFFYNTKIKSHIS